MKHIVPGIALIIGLAACEPVPPSGGGAEAPTTQAPTTQTPAAPKPTAQPRKLSRAQAQANFRAVVARVEPIAERECKRRSPDLNCDFKIIVDTNPRAPANAFQTLDRAGRPIIGFTIALIQDARNRDEVAFVMGHEAAHHIERHLQKQRDSAVGGAILGGLVAAGLGLPVDAGQQLGGTVGARAYSKQNELEADALGTVITKRAGYNPVLGAQFFTRIPDPGDRFLGTHPPNAQRIETVRRVNSRL